MEPSSISRLTDLPKRQTPNFLDRPVVPFENLTNRKNFQFPNCFYSEQVKFKDRYKRYFTTRILESIKSHCSLTFGVSGLAFGIKFDTVDLYRRLRRSAKPQD